MKSILFLAILLWPFFTHAQKDEGQNNRFPDGVYLKADEILDKDPAIKSLQVRTADGKNPKVKTWFRNDSLFYDNDKGQKTLLPVKNIFAFVSDGEMYIQRKGYGHKVSMAGMLCYFTESYPIRNAPMSPVTLDMSKDITPRILDLHSGEFLDYTVAVLEEVLKERDEFLFAEYTAIENPKTKRNLLLRYLEKYNERHPLPNKKEL
ncbi:MAG: hypothetical protein JNL88_08190 [Bacteroidia bacterium]|nr:hypothetical protein [Bacteroidia bacterium]